MKRLAVLLLAIVAVSCSGDGQADRQGEQESPTRGVTPGPPAERWRFELGEGYVLVAADERTVIVSNAPQYDLNFVEGIIVALAPDTGLELWRVTLPCAPFLPALAKDLVLIPCHDGTVYAFERATGVRSGSTRVAPRRSR